MNKNILVAGVMLMAAQVAVGQAPTFIGKASYTEKPPTYKSKADGGRIEQMTTSRKVWLDETPGEPIPTNDWWTSVIDARYSGAMWSLPGMISTDASGVRVAYPTYWDEGNGTELKYKSYITVAGVDYKPAEARATKWHDWDVSISLPATTGNGRIDVTMVHGMPFTWFEFNSVTPEIAFNKTPVVTAKNGGVLVEIDGDFYGFYLPAGFSFRLDEGRMILENSPWMSVGLLPSAADFEAFAAYAPNKVTDTKVSWSYNESTSLVSTRWEVSTKSLANGAEGVPVIQGFLPHVYKHMDASSSLAFNGKTYLTPRGLMKMSTGNIFEYAYKFYGMLPYYARPEENNLTGTDAANSFNADTARELLKNYAENGTFGGDTYWGGKGLTQMALNMMFAKEMGYDDIYEESKGKLRDILTDWFTYTPGEQNKFFSYYPRWGGMIGFDYSYGSETFNDHHFHFGYFLYASALLCLEDKEFAEDYGGLIKMIAQDYANWDRNDKRFPFLRTLDIWAGHSYAGGLGDQGNENGNGQESSSEAMQGWGGVYMLGVALNDKDMRDAGIFGWMTESRATVEYWFDRDHIKYADRETNYDPTKYNYDYRYYKSPYNTNITSKGIGWWTWFAGGIWMHAIQWMPTSPCLNYLSEDLDFVKFDYETMWNNEKFKWFEKVDNDHDALAGQSLGNVALSYMQRYNPEEAARIFQRAYNEGFGIAKNADTGHISYFATHSHLTYGEIDTKITASIPTANVYVKDGRKTYHVYNPGTEAITVTFSDGKTVKAAPGRLTAFAEDPVATSIEITVPEYIAPGSSAAVSARCLDQYGVEINAPAAHSWTVDGMNGKVTYNNGTITLAGAQAWAGQIGAEVPVTVTCGSLTASVSFRAMSEPKYGEAVIRGLSSKAESGYTATMSLFGTDQYGETAEQDAVWTVTAPGAVPEQLKKAEYTFNNPGKYVISAVSTKDNTLTAQAEIIILADLPDIATSGMNTYASSNANNGYKVLDGVVSNESRWESVHDDGQWFVLDLGKDYDLTSVIINWEAAYAADYDIDIAPASAALAGYTRPADNKDICDRIVNANAWMTVYQERGHNKNGIAKHAIAGTGRFIRIRALKRATNYGVSFYELGVHAVPENIDENAIVGLTVGIENNPVQMAMGATVKLLPKSVTLNGTLTDLNADQLTWSCDSTARFTGNQFKALRPGMNTITATLKSNPAIKGYVSIFVDEIALPSALTADPWRFDIEQGTEQKITIGCKSQLGNAWEDLSNFKFSAVITDEGDPVAANVASFDPATGIFSSNVPGKYTIMLSATASGLPVDVEITPVKIIAHVIDSSDISLTQGKRVWATSSNGNDLPERAVDGDSNTRWQSSNEGVVAGQDNIQDLTVDLGNNYLVRNFLISWEAANATDYEIQLSKDREIWTTVHRRTGYSKGAYTDTHIMDQAVSARYVRVHCIKPVMNYGYSIYELKVFGEGLGDSPEPTELVGDCTHNPDVPATPKNLALKKNVTSPYTRDYDDPKIWNAGLVDGVNNADHSWESVHQTKPVHVTVDLGKVYAVDKVNIFWERSFARDFRVEYSQDAKTWYVARTIKDWDGVSEETGVPAHTYVATFRKAPKHARYVRIKADKHDINEEMWKYGFRINELEVYGDAVDTPQTPADPEDDGSDEPRRNLAQGRPAVSSDAAGNDVDKADNQKSANATDGNMDTVWESKDGIDDVYLTVDLKHRYSITDLKIVWGTPWARDYEVQVLGENDEWITVHSRNDWEGAAGKADEYALSTPVETQKVRIHCTERATTWGYGIKEFELYGEGPLDLEVNPDPDPEPDPEEPESDNLALHKTATATTTTTNAAGYEADKAVDGNTTTRWESDATEDPEIFTVDLHKVYLINRVKIDWEVRCARNFMLQYSYDGKVWRTLDNVKDFDHNAENVNNHLAYEKTLDADRKARYVRVVGTVSSQTRYSIWEFEVYGNGVDNSGIDDNEDPIYDPNAPEIVDETTNLALGKHAWASTERNATGAEGPARNATDGSLGTRWQSNWQNDPEWIIVDLKWPYEIHKIRITWEGAYAKDYIVETALDAPETGQASSMMRAPEAANWNTYAQRTDYDGSNGLVEVFTNAANPEARYIRITGTRRALNDYGYSIKEIEAYGANVSTGVTGVEVDNNTVDVYTIQGLPVLIGVERNELRDKLPAGIYIIRDIKSARKVVIR